MAVGQVKEMLSQAHPVLRHRSRRYSKVRPRNSVLDSKVGLIAYCLACIVNVIPMIIIKVCPKWFLSLLQWWWPTSSQTFDIVEKHIFSNLSRTYTAKYVNIGPCWSGTDNLIWTIHMNPSGMAEKVPLVLLHGFASGSALWVMNLDSLSSYRSLYAIDILGFGKSSRPAFSNDAVEVEQQFVTFLEMWRRAVGIEKFILLGHSMGGYIAAAYALQHPKCVSHLILVDPWGFPERPISFLHRYELPNWVKFISAFLSGFNPLSVVRAAGPVGPYLIEKLRSDLSKKYKQRIRNISNITTYIYHCNAQNPSGEVAFKVMSNEQGWAKFPMISRINDLHSKIPITFIYGSRSWANRQPAVQIKYSRLSSFIDIQVIENAGHHVYADRPEQFNVLVNRVCESVEALNL